MRKQKGKLQLKRRVKITYPYNHIAFYANKTINFTLEQYKILKLDLTRSGLIPYYLIPQPNKPTTLKGILVRMGKGKGKIKSYHTRLETGTVVLVLKPTSFSYNPIHKILKKYPFLSKFSG